MKCFDMGNGQWGWMKLICCPHVWMSGAIGITAPRVSETGTRKVN